MNEQIIEWLLEAKLKTKEFYAHDPYGNFPDSIVIYYWNPYRNEWALEKQALEGYILTKITPIIQTIIKEKLCES